MSLKIRGVEIGVSRGFLKIQNPGWWWRYQNSIIICIQINTDELATAIINQNMFYFRMCVCVYYICTNMYLYILYMCLKPKSILWRG